LFDKSKSLRQILGDPLVDAYTVIKQREWDDYSRNLSDWERQNTLDT
jgi:glutamine synthetase